jgi:2-enoate reductase
MMMLRDLLKFHKVNVLTDTALSEVTDEGVIVVDKSSQKITVPADTVVIAVGLVPDRELCSSLKDSVPNLHVVGDAVEARNIMHAIWDAYEAARKI